MNIEYINLSLLQSRSNADRHFQITNTAPVVNDRRRRKFNKFKITWNATSTNDDVLANADRTYVRRQSDVVVWWQSQTPEEHTYKISSHVHCTLRSENCNALVVNE